MAVTQFLSAPRLFCDVARFLEGRVAGGGQVDDAAAHLAVGVAGFGRGAGHRGLRIYVRVRVNVNNIEYPVEITNINAPIVSAAGGLVGGQHNPFKLGLGLRF